MHTVPGLITPAIQAGSDSEVIINWNKTGANNNILRYVVDVREYSSAGPGKIKKKRITGYPREIAGTETQHRVNLLSKTLLNKMFLSLMITYSVCNSI